MEKEKKKVVSDHYRVLGLPSGKEGSKLNERAIIKAYRAKALQLHPDKRPNDPNANDKFQRLQSSYAILMDPRSRKQFDASLVRLENKTPSSEPKRKTTSADKPKKQKDHEHEDELYILGYIIIVLGPMIFPVGRTCAGFVFRGVILFCSMEGLKSRQQVENVWSIVVRAGNYLKQVITNPPIPNAATNPQGHDDHEDIEDWVMV